MIMAKEWKVTGTYFEACNCDVAYRIDRDDVCDGVQSLFSLCWPSFHFSRDLKSVFFHSSDAL
jgi:hypothetical protein